MQPTIIPSFIFVDKHIHPYTNQNSLGSLFVFHLVQTHALLHGMDKHGLSGANFDTCSYSISHCLPSGCHLELFALCTFAVSPTYRRELYVSDI